MFAHYMRDRKLHGFINIYLDDVSHDSDYKEAVYILFDPLFTLKYQEYERFLAESPLCIEIYSIHEGILNLDKNEKVMFVFNIPDEFVEDYHHYLNGDYSKFSEKYKRKFNPKSLPYRGIHKDAALKRAWEKKLGRILTEKNELYGLWKPTNEIYNYNNKQNESENN